MTQDEVRKGPWTEQEDAQLVCFVGLFGDRRWDFIAKVSGLKVAGDHNRTGKSCRLRWVNYLHPGLKRGKMTPQEEKLVLELQSRWGNRWSRIAKKLPGRTDNEIKNYWRTHIRKVSQEKKRTVSLPSSSSPALKDPKVDSITMKASGAESFYDTGGPEPSSSTEIKSREVGKKTEHAMDDIWGEIALSEEDAITPANEYCGESLWETQGEECKMLPRSTDSLFSCYAELEYLR